VVLEEDCSEEVVDEALLVEEVPEAERDEAWVVELGEAVEVVVLCGEVRTYAAPNKTRATTKTAAATCALLAPLLFKKVPPKTEHSLSRSQ
jgi:hypothetical protein